MGGRIVICDGERSYALHLMEYFYASGELPCEIRVCTDPEKLAVNAPPEETDLLVVSETFLGEMRGAEAYGAVLVLTEEGGGGTALPESAQTRGMSKYSRAGQILETAEKMYLEAGPALPGRQQTAFPLRIIGVYSPAGGCSQTELALGIGKFLAAESGDTPHRVLYMNLEPCSGLAERLGAEFRGSLSDLLYYQACAPEQLAARLRLLQVTQDGLDILPPMRSWMALRDISGETWLQLLESIRTGTDYAELVLDLTEHADGFTEILRRCDEILLPLRGDPAADAKLHQLEEILKEQEAGDVWGRIRSVALSGEAGQEPGGGMAAWSKAYFYREHLCRS